MATEDLSLRGLRSLPQALERTATGTDAVELAKRLGIWTARAHATPGERPDFVRDLADLEPSQLSRLLGNWTAEFGRIIELCGVVAGQEAALKIELKSAQAKSRTRIRRKREEDGLKPLASAALNDEADEDTNVIDLYERASLLVVLAASANAAREATQQYLASISREIAFRDAQMKAKLY